MSAVSQFWPEGDRALARQAQLLESVKGICIGLEREQREQHRGGIDLAMAIVRSLTCRFKAYGRTDIDAEGMLEQLYPPRRKGAEYHHIRQALTDLPALVQRAAVSPASTTTPTWAAELAATDNYSGVLPSIAPSSAYAQLAARGLRVALAGRTAMKLPARAASPTLNGDFILEGNPIPTRKLGLTLGATLSPRKLAVLSHFSLEMAEWSVPSIESVIKQEINADTSLVLDSRLLDSVAGSATRPAGLLNGVTPITASAATPAQAALVADLSALTNAIAAPVDLVFIMSGPAALRARMLSPGLLTLPIIIAPGLTTSVIAVDAADFVSAESDSPRFDMSGGGTMHEEDSPLPLGVTGSPNVVAAPLRSLWQTDAAAVRMITWCTWAMRRASRVSTVASVTW
jgi:hypothetical protein